MKMRVYDDSLTFEADWETKVLTLVSAKVGKKPCNPQNRISCGLKRGKKNLNGTT